MNDPYNILIENVVPKLIRLESLTPENKITNLLDKRVMIFGGAGSIGSAIVECLPSGCEVLCFDSNQNSLFNLQNHLNKNNRNIEIKLICCDIRDIDRCERLIIDFNPDICLHLAAMKHVPLGEETIEDTFSVNFLFSAKIFELCAYKCNCKVVFFSTDKATSSENMYGLSKRLSEFYLMYLSRYSEVETAIIRLVNVISSKDNVIEKFVYNAKNNIQLPITDPNMSRFWMSMNDVIDTLNFTISYSMGNSNKLITLGCQPEVNIIEFAKLIWAEYSNLPFKYEIINARKGEIFREKLFDPEFEITHLISDRWFDIKTKVDCNFAPYAMGFINSMVESRNAHPKKISELKEYFHT